MTLAKRFFPLFLGLALAVAVSSFAQTPAPAAEPAEPTTHGISASHIDRAVIGHYGNLRALRAGFSPRVLLDPYLEKALSGT